MDVAPIDTNAITRKAQWQVGEGQRTHINKELEGG